MMVFVTPLYYHLPGLFTGFKQSDKKSLKPIIEYH